MGGWGEGGEGARKAFFIFRCKLSSHAGRENRGSYGREIFIE
jgi:hypothetical protein